MKRFLRIYPDISHSMIDKQKTMGGTITDRFGVAKTYITMNHLKKVLGAINWSLLLQAFLRLETWPSSKGESVGWMNMKLG